MDDGSRTSDGTRERQGKPRVNYCGPQEGQLFTEENIFRFEGGARARPQQ